MPGTAPVALARVELDRKAARVAQRLRRAALVDHCREPHNDRRLHTRRAEYIRARQVGDVVRHLTHPAASQPAGLPLQVTQASPTSYQQDMFASPGGPAWKLQRGGGDAARKAAALPRRSPWRWLPVRGRPAPESAHGRTAKQGRVGVSAQRFGQPCHGTKQQRATCYCLTCASFSIKCCTHTHSNLVHCIHTVLHRAQPQTGNSGNLRARCAHSPPAGSALHPDARSRGEFHSQVHSSLQNRQLFTCAGEISSAVCAPRVPTVRELLLFQTGMPLLVVQ